MSQADTLKPPRACSVVKAHLAGDVARQLVEFGESLPPMGWWGEGVEQRPHVTVLYGLRTDSAEDVARVIRRECLRGGDLMLGPLGRFPMSDHDVLYAAAVVPEELLKLRHELARALVYRDRRSGPYLPHVTVARMVRGAARSYVGDRRFIGIRAPIDEVVFSSRARVETVIKLGE
jgi:2'-5' RNA ligase